MGADSRGGIALNESRLRLFHTTLAIATAGILLVFITTPSETWKTIAPPDAPAALAEYIATHPADAKAAAKITDAALDYPIPKRHELWHAANDLARFLEPYRTNAQIAFARAGVFHWAELSEGERKEVLASIGPLLNDANRFQALSQPVWALTHDLELLVRYAPRTESATLQLVELAATNGEFDAYRRLRDEAHRLRYEEAKAKLATLTAPQLLQLLRPPFRVADEPLIVDVLHELQARPLDEDPQSPAVDALIEYAIDHHLAPLEGLEAITRMKDAASTAHRARLAIALELPDRANDLEIGSAELSPAWRSYFIERAEFESAHGNEDRAATYRAKASLATTHDQQWSGLCGAELCTNAHAELEGPRNVTVETTAADEVPPWVELYVDEALRDEGPVAPKRTFTIPKGRHRVELQLANPMTRNRSRRRVRIA